MPATPHASLIDTSRDRGHWQGMEHRLAEVVVRLVHRESVVLDDWTGQGRYVQALRTGSVLTVECSGPQVDGGPADLTPQTQAALLGLGWPPVDGGGFPNYRDFWLCSTASDQGWGDWAGATEAAGRMVSSLRILGVPSPDRLRLVRHTNPDPDPWAMPSEYELAEVREAIAERLRRRPGIVIAGDN